MKILVDFDFFDYFCKKYGLKNNFPTPDLIINDYKLNSY